MNVLTTPVKPLDWRTLGAGYPVDKGSLATQSAFDVLAPVKTFEDGQVRLPIFEWGHETTPLPHEVWDLAEQLVSAVVLGFLPKP